MIDEAELVERVAKRIYFEFVDAQGYPNGQRTWGELIEAAAKGDQTAHWELTAYRSMALGAIQVIEHAKAEDEL